MRKLNISFLFKFFFICFLPGALFAQQTIFFEDVSADLELARELYSLGKYNSAFRQFEIVQNKYFYL